MSEALTEGILHGRGVRMRAPGLLSGSGCGESATDRQERVPGFDQEAVSRARVGCVGAGGLAEPVLRGLARKGYGDIVVCDPDVFDETNYNRQLCYRGDLYRNKAKAAAANLAGECVGSAVVTGVEGDFESTADAVDWSGMDVLLCLVDNSPARRALAAFCVGARKPCVFAGVSNDASSGYAFVQEPGSACWGCAFGNEIDDDTFPCPGTPACRDILSVLGGHILHAVDSLLMPRRRCWNHRWVTMDGSFPDSATEVGRNGACRLCGHQTCPSTL